MSVDGYSTADNARYRVYHTRHTAQINRQREYSSIFLSRKIHSIQVDTYFGNCVRSSSMRKSYPLLVNTLHTLFFIFLPSRHHYRLLFYTTCFAIPNSFRSRFTPPSDRFLGHSLLPLGPLWILFRKSDIPGTPASSLFPVLSRTTSRIGVLFSNDTVRLSCSCCPLANAGPVAASYRHSYRDFWLPESPLGTCARSKVYNTFVATASPAVAVVSPEIIIRRVLPSFRGRPNIYNTE